MRVCPSRLSGGGDEARWGARGLRPAPYCCSVDASHWPRLSWDEPVPSGDRLKPAKGLLEWDWCHLSLRRCCVVPVGGHCCLKPVFRSLSQAKASTLGVWPWLPHRSANEGGNSPRRTCAKKSRPPPRESPWRWPSWPPSRGAIVVHAIGRSCPEHRARAANNVVHRLGKCSTVVQGQRANVQVQALGPRSRKPKPARLRAHEVYTPALKCPTAGQPAGGRDQTRLGCRALRQR